MPNGRRWLQSELPLLGHDATRFLTISSPGPLASRPDGMFVHRSVHVTVFFFFGTRIPWWAPVGTHLFIWEEIVNWGRISCLRRQSLAMLNPNLLCVYDPVWRTCSCVFHNESDVKSRFVWDYYSNEIIFEIPTVKGKVRQSIRNLSTMWLLMYGLVLVTRLHRRGGRAGRSSCRSIYFYQHQPAMNREQSNHIPSVYGGIVHPSHQNEAVYQ